MGELQDRITAAVTAKFYRGYQDAVAKMLVELFWAQRHDLFEFNTPGKQLEWRFRFQRGTPMGFTGTEGRTIAIRNDYKVAVLPWRGIADNIVITWSEMNQVKGKEAILNLMPDLLENMTADLNDRFGTDWYGDGTSLSSKTFHGLAASIGTGSPVTYAGQSQSSVTAWAAQNISGAGFTLDPLSKLLALQMACAVGEKGGRTRNQISVFFCSKTEFQTVANSEVVKQRYEQDIEMAAAGFKNISCWGVPLAWSEYCAAGTVWGANHNLFSIPCTTGQLFESKSMWTPGFPHVLLGMGMSQFNMVNKNPRGSGSITSIT